MDKQGGIVYSKLLGYSIGNQAEIVHSLGYTMLLLIVSKIL
jgi:hypothetical protein